MPTTASFLQAQPNSSLRLLLQAILSAADLPCLCFLLQAILSAADLPCLRRAHQRLLHPSHQLLVHEPCAHDAGAGTASHRSRVRGCDVPGNQLQVSFMQSSTTAVPLICQVHITILLLRWESGPGS